MTKNFICYSEPASGKHLFSPLARNPRAKWNKLVIGSNVNGSQINTIKEAAEIFAARYAKREYGSSWELTGGSVRGKVEQGDIFEFGVKNRSLCGTFRIALVSE